MDLSQGLNWTTIDQLAASLTPEERARGEWTISNASKVPEGDAAIVLAVLFAVASLAFFGRIGIRLATRKRILLDDGLLIISFCCLIAATAIFYKRRRYFYMVDAVIEGDMVVSLMAAQEINNIFLQMNWSFAYMTFIWTTIFGVKLCYFAFFHTLLRSMPKKLIRFYWVCVVAAVVSWIFLILEQLITCPYFGDSSIKCFPSLPMSKTVRDFTLWIGQILDGVIDITIIAIPIMVLSKSQMSLASKIGFGIFLCLSAFMLVCVIIRSAGTFFHHGIVDTPWLLFWLHTEACVAILMASVTVYRPILAGTLGGGSAPSGLQKLWYKVRQASADSKNLHAQQQPVTSRGRFGRFLLSKIPSKTISGLGTMLGVDPSITNMSPHATDPKDSMTLDSTTSTASVSEPDHASYHEYLRNPPAAHISRTTHITVHSHSPESKPPPRFALQPFSSSSASASASAASPLHSNRR